MVKLQCLRWIFLLCAGLSLPAHAKVCTAKDAVAAEAAIDELDSWQKVHAAFLRYDHCDDASIAEGNSEAVARLLADQWPTLPALASLARRDPAFKKFVLKHVDATLDTADLKRVADHATLRCPKEATAICRAIAAAARRSMQP